MRPASRLLIALLNVLCLAAACAKDSAVPDVRGASDAAGTASDDDAGSTEPDATSGADGGAVDDVDAGPSLVGGFAGCDEMLEYVRDHAHELINASPIGAPFPKPECFGCEFGPPEFVMPRPRWVDMEEHGEGHGGAVQVHDGVVYAWWYDRVFSLPVSGRADDLSVLSSLPTVSHMPTRGSMFLAGDRALIVREAPRDDEGGEAAVLVEIDISDPDAMAVLRTRRIPGKLVDARRVGDRVRIAIQSEPNGIAWEIAGTGGANGTVPSDDEDAVAAARVHNHEQVAASDADNWLPTYRDEDGDADATDSMPLLDCAHVMKPDEPSGASMLSLVDIDVAAGLASARAVGMFAQGATLFGNGQRTWIQTVPWRQLSDMWQLDASGPGRPVSLLHGYDGERFTPLGAVRISGAIIDLAEHVDASGVFVLTVPKPGAEAGATVLFVDWDEGALRIRGVSDSLGEHRPTGLTLSRDILIAGPGALEIPARVIDISTLDNPTPRGTLDLFGPQIRLLPLPDRRIAAIGWFVGAGWNYDVAMGYATLLDGDEIVGSLDLGDFQPDTQPTSSGFDFDPSTNLLVTCGFTYVGTIIDGVDCIVLDLASDTPRRLGKVMHPQPVSTPEASYGYRQIFGAAIDGSNLVTVSQTELRITELPSMQTRLSVELPFPP